MRAALLLQCPDGPGIVAAVGAFVAERGPPKVSAAVTAFPMEHCNVISSWAVSAKGEVTNVYV